MSNLIGFTVSYIIEILIFMIIIITGLVVIRIWYGKPASDNSPRTPKKIVTIESLTNREMDYDLDEEATETQSESESEPESNLDKRYRKKITSKKLRKLMKDGRDICSDTSYTRDEHDQYCSKYFNEKDNCTANSCCVWLNNKKCVGGDRHGPTYLSNGKKPINIEYYHYKNDCFGNDEKCK